MVWLDQFADTPQVCDVMTRCKTEAEVRGAFSALFYITDPRSIYRNKLEQDRIPIVLNNHVDPAAVPVVSKIVESEEFKLLQYFYLSLVTTPSERLYLALQRQVSNYTDRVSSADITPTAKSGKELLESINYAQDAAERLRDMSSFLREEAKTKIRAGYQEKLFEKKDE